MVVRGGGSSGAGLDRSAAVAGAVCEGAAVIGPEGACAWAASATIRPSKAIPATPLGLNKNVAFMFDPQIPQVKLHFLEFPPAKETVPHRKMPEFLDRAG